jgi:hypothetical protein
MKFPVAQAKTACKANDFCSFHIVEPLVFYFERTDSFECFVCGIGRIYRRCFSLYYRSSHPSQRNRLSGGNTCDKCCRRVCDRLVFRRVRQQRKCKPKPDAFLTVGVCGGFTTFSAFSLEIVTLLEGGKHWMGIIYAVLSFALCVLGVTMGRLLAKGFTGLPDN